MRRDFTGDQATLILDGESYPVTEKSLSIDTQTTDSQFDDTRPGKTSKAVTGVDISGSFSQDGRDANLRQAVLDAPAKKGRLIFREDDGNGVRFNGVTLSFSQDYPSDDVAEATVDWEAEEYVLI
jgi:hypothetical protein